MVQISQTVNLMGIYGRKTIAMKHFFAGIGEIHFLLFYYYSSWYDIGINFGIIKSVQKIFLQRR